MNLNRRTVSVVRWRAPALAAALLGAAGWAATQPARTGALNDGRGIDWKTSASLPLGAEYHLVREDPKTGGVQALVRFPKGYSLPPHSHEFDETLIVLKGKLRIKLDGTERVLGRTGYASIPAGAVHEMQSAGWNGVIMIITTNGPYSFQR